MLAKIAKDYMGDGVYVEYDGYTLKLTAEDGEKATDTIVVDPPMWRALQRYVKRIEEQEPGWSQQ